MKYMVLVTNKDTGKVELCSLDLAENRFTDHLEDARELRDDMQDSFWGIDHDYKVCSVQEVV